MCVVNQADQNAAIEALLSASAGGDTGARDQLVSLFYDELRMIAHRHRWRWGGPAGPGTTSIVHEVYLNLNERQQAKWTDKSEFFRFASVVMRNLLVDQARAAQRQKRDNSGAPDPGRPEDPDKLLSLNDALNRLAISDARLASIVEHRFFGGLTVDETAAAMDISPATVKRGWDAARAWLYVELDGESGR